MSKIQNVVEKFQKLYISVCGSCRLIMPKCVSGNILKGYNSQNTWKKHLRKYKQGFLFLVYQRSCSLLCNSHSAMNDKWKVPERILIHSCDVIFWRPKPEMSFPVSFQHVVYCLIMQRKYLSTQIFYNLKKCQN